MIEVAVKLRFNQHCLGNCRQNAVRRFLHDANGNVLFLPTWWAAIMRYAAKLLNRHQRAVSQIDWDPVVVGRPREYRRFYAPHRYTRHEAFHPGDTITIHAVLPADITCDDFRELLDVAGRYKGMSPYKPESRFGTFEVRDVAQGRRPTTQNEGQ